MSKLKAGYRAAARQGQVEQLIFTAAEGSTAAATEAPITAPGPSATSSAPAAPVDRACLIAIMDCVAALAVTQ